MIIRPEAAADREAISGVNLEAFGGDVEANLVNRLRDDGSIITSLVAVDDAEHVVGHILFSPVAVVTDEHELLIASLAPMAVVPARQRSRIGSMLIAGGLQACKDAGYRAAIVVGHPDYYPRFGFSHSLVENLENPFTKSDAFMGIELARGSLSGLGHGRIVYPRAFDNL